jgi:hypothetical protein
VAKSDAETAVRFGPLRRVLDAAAGARLCFGEPVTAGDRTVGGRGYGHGDVAVQRDARRPAGLLHRGGR